MKNKKTNSNIKRIVALILAALFAFSALGAVIYYIVS